MKKDVKQLNSGLSEARSDILSLQLDIESLKTTVSRLKFKVEDCDKMKERIKQLECYEDYGHDWLYQVHGGCSPSDSIHEYIGRSYEAAMVRAGKYHFKCRFCGKKDWLEWKDLSANMKAQVRAIDPELVPKKKKGKVQ